MFGISLRGLDRAKAPPPIDMYNGDPFVRFPAQVRELNIEADRNPVLDRALRNPYFIAETDFFETINTVIKIGGTLTILVYGPKGLGKSRLCLGIWEYIVRPIWAALGYVYDKPTLAFSYAQAAFAIGDEAKRGITIFADERTYLMGQNSRAVVDALINLLDTTSREMQKVFITAGIKQMRDMSWDLRFEILGQGRGLGCNEVLMLGPSGIPIGRMHIPICGSGLYNWYFPQKVDNERRMSKQMGFDDANIPKGFLQQQAELVIKYAEDEAWDPMTLNDKEWRSLFPDAGVAGTISLREMILTRINMLVDRKKLEQGMGPKDLPVYDKDLKAGVGFQFDYWEEVRSLYDHPKHGKVAQMLVDKHEHSFSTRELADKYKVSTGKVSLLVGKGSDGYDRRPVQRLKGEINLRLSAKHEHYVQLKWQQLGFERHYMPGEPVGLGRSGTGWPDRVMRKGETFAVISCKSTRESKDFTVLKHLSQKTQHTGMDPEIKAWEQLRQEYADVYIILEFANTSEKKHEEATIAFTDTDSIPEHMNTFARDDLKIENKWILEKIIEAEVYANLPEANKPTLDS